MKRFTFRILALSLVTIFSLQAYDSWAQEVSINATGAAANANSMLDVSSTTKGVLLPRMTTAQRGSDVSPGTGLAANLIASGTGEGMTVFDTDLDAYFYWDGSAWRELLSSNSVTSLDDAYDAGGPGNGRVIDADQGPVEIQNSSTFSLVTDEAVGIGTSTPTNRLHVYNFSTTGGEEVLGRFEFNASTGNGTTGGIKILGDRGQAANEVAFVEFENIAGSTLLRLTSNSVGDGQLMVQTGDGSGGLVERMVLDNDGNLQLDGLIETEKSVITSTTAGVLESLPIGTGNGDKVLKVNSAGNDIEWGDATVSTLPLSNLAGGSNGDVLYHNGTNWVALSPPGSAAPTGEVFTLTLPNAGSGTPSWEESGNYTSDNLGSHVATQNIETSTFAIVASDGIVNVDDNLSINGKVVSDGINETSDARFKKNINLISNALSTVLSLEGVTYNWRTEEFPEKKFHAGMEYGVIAQQIEKYVPELVNTDEETGYKSVQYSHMVPLLIEAIKEQNKLLSKQDSEIAELKASVESLSEHISTSKK